MRDYIDTEGLFQIQHPNDWRIDATGRTGTRVAFLCPQVVDDFQANVNVIVGHVPPLTEEEFLTLSRLQLKQLSGTATLPIDEPAGVWHVFEWVNRHMPVQLIVRQQVMFADGKAYILSATGLASNFDSYRPIFDEVFQSFKPLQSQPV